MADPLSDEGFDLLCRTARSYKPAFLCALGYGDPASIFERRPRLTFEEFATIA